MSGTTLGDAFAAMSKAQKLASVQFGLALIAGACMGWLWWSSWPDGEALIRNAQMFDRWPDMLMIAAVISVAQIKRHGPKEPLKDERDLAISGQARTHSFTALGLMVVVLSTVMRLDSWRSHVTPEWISLALMSMLALALMLDTAYRLVRYRWG